MSIYSLSTNSYSTPISIPIVANNPSLSLEYEIEMSKLTDLTDPLGLYKYTQGTLIKAIVWAENEKGFG